MGFLRILLALAVVIEHSSSVLGWRFMPGNVAVESFFIISGFYMALILNEKYSNPQSNWLFFSNRFLRLFPIYWAVLLLTILASYISYLWIGNSLFFSVYLEYPISTLAYFLFGLINILIIGQDTTVFLELQTTTNNFVFTNNFRESTLAASRFLLIPQAWSLSLELLFYLVAPFLLRRSSKIILITMLASLVIRLFILYDIGWNHDPWNRRFFPSELMLFLVGALAYKMYSVIKQNKQFIKLTKSIAIFILMISLFYRIIPTFTAKEYVYYTLLFVSLPFLFEATQKIRFDNIIGEYSYPVYLVHILIVRILLAFTTPPKEYLGIITILLSLALSYCLIRWISEPLERLREIRVQKFQKPT